MSTFALLVLGFAAGIFVLAFILLGLSGDAGPSSQPAPPVIRPSRPIHIIHYDDAPPEAPQVEPPSLSAFLSAALVVAFLGLFPVCIVIAVVSG